MKNYLGPFFSFSLLDNEEKTGQFNPVQFAFPFSFFPIIRTQFSQVLSLEKVN